MPEVRQEITIDKPIQEVFEFISDPEHQLLVNSNMLRYAHDGPMEKGMRANGATKVAGREVDWSMEVIEYDPWRTIAYRSLEAPMAFTIDWTFEDITNHSTKVTFHQEVEELGGFFGKLSDALVTRLYSHDVHSNLAHIKEVLEHDD